MYLSQLILNPLSRKARTDLSNPYELHRSLMRAFPARLSPEERVLFRLDHVGRGDDPSTIVLVQSVFLPNWSPLAGREDYLLQDPAVKSLGGLAFTTGQVLRFRLRANPSRRDGKTGDRVGLIKEEERLTWLQRKAAQCGFMVVNESIIQTMNLNSFTAHKQASSASIEQEKQIFHLTINMVDYEGVLEVKDPNCFLTSLRNGIGPAKGLGCGLLSLARMNAD